MSQFKRECIWEGLEPVWVIFICEFWLMTLLEYCVKLFLLGMCWLCHLLQNCRAVHFHCHWLFTSSCSTESSRWAWVWNVSPELVLIATEVMRSWLLLHMSLCISVHIRACHSATNQSHLTTKSTDPFIIAPEQSNLAVALGDWLSFGFVKHRPCLICFGPIEN